MLEIAEESGGIPRAFLRIGRSTIAGQQLAVALQLGCERIVCLALGLTPEIVELQHQAERAGAQFHIIPGARPLLGLVTATDELIAFADGLFSSRDQATALLVDQQSVLVQPIEQGLAAGFERLDLNHAAAGAMRIPGRLAERLGELPADCDVVSSLQRIALQAGVRQRSIGPVGAGGSFWSLVRSDAEAHAIEPQWIRQRSSDSLPAGPTRVLATLAVRSFGPALLHAGSGSGIVVSAAMVTALLALGSGWLGLISLGFALCALGWFLSEFARLLARVETEGELRKATGTSLDAYGWVIDGLLVMLLGLASHPLHAMPMAERFFPAAMLIALLRILAGITEGKWSRWVGDRGIISLLLLGAVAGRVAGEVAHLGSVAAAILALIAIGGKSRLTRP